MSAEDVAQQFNAAINERDLDALAARMTDDHTFVDSEGNADKGKQACVYEDTPPTRQRLGIA